MNTDQDFKTFLKRELELRIGRNPRYSMRAFAKDMNVPPSMMSDILNGKRGLSKISAVRFATKLGLNKSETELFCDLVESKHARSQTVRLQAQSRLEAKTTRGLPLKFLTLDQNKFSVVSDWYHLGILELLKTNNARFDSKWIASRLGISVLQATNALERMVALSMIKSDGVKMIPVSEFVSTPDGLSSQALKNHHEQLIQKGLSALYTQNLEERDFRGLTVKCKKSDVPNVREKIRTFLRDLDAELNQDETADEVYQLSTQFFCLTQPTPNPKEQI